MAMDVREKLVELFYDNNVRCDQKIEGLADDVIDIIAHSVTTHEWISIDVREKLVELLKSVLPNFRNNMAYWGEKPIYEFADCLLAHGVTVQEWISVKDRLPQDDSDVLAYLSIGEESRICPANYAKGVWFDCIFDMPVTESITHWMPIPQPPKGE